jgi:hypothetical protein
MTKYNYYDRPFEHRNLSVCDPLPDDATIYVPDYLPNFLNPDPWLGVVCEMPPFEYVLKMLGIEFSTWSRVVFLPDVKS